MSLEEEDAAGRQQSIGGYGFTYDAENRMTSATLNIRTVYQYDGDGRRVAKINCPGTAACDATTPGVSTVWYVYDAAGNLAVEYGQSSMASAPPCTTCYLMADHLGSTRVMMNQNGNAVTGGCHDYLPFGEEIYSGVGQRSSSCYPTTFKLGMLFTGKLRDAWGESQLDYFDERYFSAAQGRFTSVDPQNAGAIPIDPQSWNGYAYGRNNPLKYTDPTGTNYTVCDAEGKNCRDLSDKQYDQYLASIQKTNISVSPGGNINYQNADGSVTRLGTASYYNEKDVQAAQFITNQVGPLVNGLGYATLGVVAGAQLGAAYGAYVGGNGLIQLGVASGPVVAAASNPGVQATLHSAERLAERGFSAAEVALTKTGRVLSQADGARVYIKAVGDRFNVIVEGDRGVVTALKNISQKALDRLSRNYGWK